MTLSLRSVLPYHIFRIRIVIYCVWNDTSLKKCTRCLLSGLGTRLKGALLQGWVEQLLSFWASYLMPAGWCDLGLAMTSEGVQPTNSPCPVVATELMWLGHKAVYTCSQPWAAEAEGLQTCLYLSWHRRGALLQALCECCGGSEPSGQNQRLTPVIALSAEH